MQQRQFIDFYKTIYWQLNDMYNDNIQIDKWYHTDISTAS